MTVSAAYAELRFVADGTNKNFTYSWEITRAADLAVWVDGVRKTLTTHYTVTGIGVESGGEVRFLTAPANGAAITIVRDMPLTRLADLQEGAGQRTAVQNAEFDQPFLGLQQINAKADRAIRVAPFAYSDESLEIVAPAEDRAGKALIFDDAGNITVSPDQYSDTAENAAAAVAAAAEAVAAAAAAGASASSADADAGAAAASASSASTSQSLATSAAAVAVAAQAVVEAASDTAVDAAAAAAGDAASASASAIAASDDADDASDSAAAALAAQVAAEAALASTLSAYDSFDDRYLGSKASNPSVDNDGNALVAGALYYNTTVPEMRLYTGSAWVAAYVSGAAYLATANNLSDVPNAVTARSNLGLGSMATQAASSVAITGGTLGGLTKIGIGMTASSALDITTTQNNGWRITDGTVTGIGYASGLVTNSFAIGTTSNHPLAFITNNSLRATITSGGSLGLGTSSPGAKLHVVGGSLTSYTAMGSSGQIAIISGDSTANQFMLDMYDAGGNFWARRANGSPGSETALTANQVIISLNGTGRGATAYASSSRGGLLLAAAENWTDSAQGTYLQINTSAIGGAASSTAFRFYIDDLTSTLSNGYYGFIRKHVSSGEVAIGSFSNGGGTEFSIWTNNGGAQPARVAKFNNASGADRYFTFTPGASGSSTQPALGSSTGVIHSTANIGVGIIPLSNLDVKAATNEVFRVRGHITYGGGITINAENDAGSNNVAMELRSSAFLFSAGNVALNSNIGLWLNRGSTWGGNPSTDQAKIEYYGADNASSCIFINNNSGGNNIVAFRSGSSDAAYVTKTGEYTGTATSAKYADLAERYRTGAELEPGTVMVVDRTGVNELVPCSTDLDESVIGVVSARPGFKMNSAAGEDNTHPYVALRGRVRVKVTGRIRLGDALVPSKVLGHARAATKLERIHSSLAVFAKVIGLPGEDGQAEAVIL